VVSFNEYVLKDEDKELLVKHCKDIFNWLKENVATSIFKSIKEEFILEDETGCWNDKTIFFCIHASKTGDRCFEITSNTMETWMLNKMGPETVTIFTDKEGNFAYSRTIHEFFDDTRLMMGLIIAWPTMKQRIIEKVDGMKAFLETLHSFKI
jgi:hypothetical protein